MWCIENQTNWPIIRSLTKVYEFQHPEKRVQPTQVNRRFLGAVVFDVPENIEMLTKTIKISA